MFSRNLLVIFCALVSVSLVPGVASGISFSNSSNLAQTAGAALTAPSMASIASLSTKRFNLNGASAARDFEGAIADREDDEELDGKVSESWRT